MKMKQTRMALGPVIEQGGGALTHAITRLTRWCAIAIACFVLGLAANIDGAIASEQTRFKRIPTQFIAALGDPEATAGSGAQHWGLWTLDPGPRGVWLAKFDELVAANGVAPADWTFDDQDWWLDENGLIMEQPDFPVPPGKYVVTGDREAVSVLTIHPDDENGERRWELDDDVMLYDVTHLPCRSARYTPAGSSDSCTPANAPRASFKVTPGTPMPAVEGCNKQDYAVLFVIGVAVN